MSDLLSFALNTITSWANDPSNTQFFLPNFLAQLNGGSYVPLSIASWDMGTSPQLTAAGGTTICNAWIDTLNPPGNDVGWACNDATFSLASVVIDGLNNVAVLPPVLSQLDNNLVLVQYTCNLNTYSTDSVPSMQMTGDFALGQPCCAAVDATGPCDTVNPLSTTVEGAGTFEATITNGTGYPQLGISLILTFNEGPFTVSVSIPEGGLTLTGALSVSDITIDDDDQGYDWTQYAQIAFSAASTQTQLVAMLQQQLNTTGALSQLSDAIAAQLNGLVGQLGGTVPASNGVSSQQFMLDVIESGINAPGSKIFLPAMVTAASAPVLEPLTIVSGTDDLGTVTISSINFSFDVQLSNVQLAGLSNVQMPASSIAVNGSSAAFTTNFSQLTGYPQQLTLSGGIKLTDTNNNAISGTFSVAITGASIEGVAAFSGQDASTFSIAFTSLTLGAIQSSQVTATVSLEGEGSFFNNVTEKMLESDSVLTLLVGIINKAIANNLVAVSQQVTDTAQAMLANGLG